jgi:hypothetical protein
MRSCSCTRSAIKNAVILERSTDGLSAKVRFKFADADALGAYESQYKAEEVLGELAVIKVGTALCKFSLAGGLAYLEDEDSQGMRITVEFPEAAERRRVLFRN